MAKLKQNEVKNKLCNLQSSIPKLLTADWRLPVSFG